MEEFGGQGVRQTGFRQCSDLSRNNIKNRILDVDRFCKCSPLTYCYRGHSRYYRGHYDGHCWKGPLSMPKKLHNALHPKTYLTLGAGRHADGQGLYLRVKDSGARSWFFRSLVDGKAKDIGLGPVSGPDALSLADARAKAAQYRAAAASGATLEGKRTTARKEREAAKAAERASITFQAYAETYVDEKEAGWKNAKHKQQWRNTLATYAYPVVGDLPLAKITTDDVLKVLRPIWTTKPVTASRLRGRIETILSGAKVEGLRSGENPAAWRGHLDHLLAKPAKVKADLWREAGTDGHHPALVYGEAAAFIQVLRKRDSVSALALEFTILTVARVGAVIGATWRELDLDAARWTIPAARMKADKEHLVPLSARALAIIATMQGLRTSNDPDAPVFRGNDAKEKATKALSNMAMPMLLRRMHEAEVSAGRVGWIDRAQNDKPITVHGFRSTFRDWAGEATNHPRETIEHAMAHGLPDKAEASYARGAQFQKRIALMDQWATFCATPVAGKVGPMQRPAAK
jgi:integrase